MLRRRSAERACKRRSLQRQPHGNRAARVHHRLRQRSGKRGRGGARHRGHDDAPPCTLLGEAGAQLSRGLGGFHSPLQKRRRRGWEGDKHDSTHERYRKQFAARKRRQRRRALSPSGCAVRGGSREQR